MSTRLDLALRELADAAGDATDFGAPGSPRTDGTVRRLTALVQRRRATRSIGSAAVAASAVGAVALVGQQLTRDVAPAGDPDAAPGACRSAVTTLPSGPGDELSVALGERPARDLPVVAPAGPDAGLGTWEGPHAELLVQVTQVPDAGVGETRLRLLVTQDEVVVGSSQEVLGLEPVRADEALSAQAGAVDPAPAAGGSLYPLEDAAFETVATPGGGEDVAQGMALRLSACDGSGALAAGTYQVYATVVDVVGTARGSAGPWDVALTGARPGVRSLPARFPRDVPFLAGRLVAAHRQGDGWVAEVVAPGPDRAEVAARKLAQAALPAQGPAELGTEPLPAPLDDRLVARYGVGLPGWWVQVVASVTPGGEESVVYVLTPRG